jgi:cysteine desulfurase
MVNIFARKPIYLDYASLTPIDHEVLSLVQKLYDKSYANPNSLHKDGVKAQKIIDQAKKDVADCIGAHPDEIHFTSSATEANRIALSVGKALVSPIEHSSVMEGAIDPEFLEINKDGIVSLEKIKEDIKIVSVQWVNNEIGTIQPVYEIAKKVKEAGKIFHVDASQAPLTQAIDLKKVKADLLVLDGNKIYGPRGVGVLFVRRGTNIKIPRGATPNVPAIGGFALALKKINVKKNNAHFIKLNNLFDFKNINGSPRSPHILNISFPGKDAEFLLFQLDAAGISVSTKSSCMRDEDESYVLKAIGADSKSSIRFSFGTMTTEGEVKKAVEVLRKLIDL